MSVQPLTKTELRKLAIDVLAGSIAHRMAGKETPKDEDYWSLVGDWVARGPQAVLTLFAAELLSDPADATPDTGAGE